MSTSQNPDIPDTIQVVDDGIDIQSTAILFENSTSLKLPSPFGLFIKPKWLKYEIEVGVGNGGFQDERYGSLKISEFFPINPDRIFISAHMLQSYSYFQWHSDNIWAFLIAKYISRNCRAVMVDEGDDLFVILFKTLEGKHEGRCMLLQSFFDRIERGKMCP